jgi:hypothetical protein
VTAKRVPGSQQTPSTTSWKGSPGASDGGIFDFGAARYSGSLGRTAINSPVVAMASEPQRTGYWLVQAD